MSEAQKVSDVLVGRTADGERIYVSLQLRHRRAGLVETTDHGVTTNPVEFSAMGLGVGYRCREANSAGQMLDDLLKITRPAAGVTMEDISEIHRLWNRWHLNDMKAGCIHQPKGTKVGEVCAHGYSYGSAWLFESITDEDLEKIEALITKLGKLKVTYKGR